MKNVTHNPVIVNAVRALYIRQIIIPPSLCHESYVHRFASVGRMFQVRRANPTAQSVVLKAFCHKLTLGGRVRA